jgi:hypothetical protein
MKFWMKGLLALLVAFAFAGNAFAQGGGASSTGTIQGRVTDAQGAVLPGVTVTATSPSALGAQTTVTSETGNYRFPAIPPGTYEVSYELAGFNAVKRSGIVISLGFTANVNIEMALATLQETVTVSGASPVIDTSATRVVQNFKLDQLQSIPNSRDMWALLAVTPSVQMGRIDVGGNRAGTQTGYTAYGQSGQVRVLIEGINTTEGTTGAGFYFDYSSLEEVFLGTSGQSAEMPNPGVQSQFIAKSGGNTFSGEYYQDWYNNTLQGSNIPDEYTVPSAFKNSPIRAHSNEIQKYWNSSLNVGGPIKKDKIWWFGTYNKQANAVAQPNFTFDKTFDTTLWNAVAKTTYQVNQKNKLIGYYQWGQKIQPNRLPFATYTYTSPDPTNEQNSGSWVYKGEWNGTLSQKVYAEARYGDFGYYFPQITNGDEDYFWRDSGTLQIDGAHQKTENDRDRKQLTGAMTYFLDTGKGSHTIKVGAEMLKERQWIGFTQGVGGNIENVYANGVSNQVIFRIPTATEVGHLHNTANLYSQNALNANSAFLNDTWAVGKLTVNGGVRWDQYKGWLPEQQSLGATVGPAVVQAETFAETDLYTWNVFAPRIGVVYDLTGDGKTVIKGNYGLYWFNPGVGVSSDVNPNTSSKNETWGWNDINADKRWQQGEQTTLQSSSLKGATGIDPNISAPYTNEAAVWLERQVTDQIGLRTGFVYKTEDNLFSLYVPARGPDVYAANGVPFNFTDIGVDGVRGSADDRVLTYLGLPTSGGFGTKQIEMNTGQYSRYKTFETSMNKRYGNKWSASIGGSFTWLGDFPNGAFPQNPAQPGFEERTQWNFKASGSYDAPFGIRLSPVLRHQSGTAYARTNTLTFPTGITGTGTTIYMEPMNANREDNVTVIDIKAEKSVTLHDRLKARLFVDGFNLTNSHASETISRQTGTGYQKPSAILAPITMRLGVRLVW